ncbi:antibiotic biosynthesis monooxygenase family protein [Rhodopirellula sp. SWK7]|uniref:antibiotic biosynthesis monooxygenase family protein n=1 Tax=Rhodopirellula sp. SWK7 TaxID=595460 RepID=UPI001F2EF1BA|nr:antibiotic biosynthesis monooxygenase family protein [Rhodopirellula sp. SWK7]
MAVDLHSDAHAETLTMVTEYTLLHVHPGFQKKFESTLPVALELITNASGYISHDVQRSVDDSSQYMLIVRWKSRADSCENFRTSGRLHKIKLLLHKFYEIYPVTHFYETVALEKPEPTPGEDQPTTLAGDK